MTVFKNYFKIAKKYLPLIMIYTITFSIFAIASVTANSTGGTFTAVKPKLVIVDNDNTIVTKTFKKYMNNYSKAVDMEEDKLEDALFYRQIDAVLKIPKSFSTDFSHKLQLEKLPDSANAAILEQYINQYFQTVSVYKKSGMSDEDISKNIINDLKTDSNVTMLNKESNKIAKVTNFYNFLSYVFLAITISIIGIIMSSFIDEKIKKRNLISGYSYKKINFELLLANSVFTISIWLLFVLISIGLFGNTLFTMGGLLLILNFFIFSTVCLSIGFFLGSLIKNKEAQNGICNVVALGSSFIAGAFVPQEFLGPFVLGIAKLTPSYWFIKNNNDIANLSNYDLESLQPIFLNIGVMIIFAITFFIMTNIISKILRKKN